LAQAVADRVVEATLDDADAQAFAIELTAVDFWIHKYPFDQS
jgi:hypothetical protein